MKQILSIIFSSACLISASVAQGVNPAALPALSEENTSPFFAKVIPHVELGGRYFAYEDYSFLTFWAGFIDKAFALVPRENFAMLPKDFSITKIADDLGLLGLKAIGSSSRANGALYHNRSFYYLPEGRKGIFTLSGGEAKPYVSPTLAPADSDLITEFDLNVKDASAAIIDMMKKYAVEPDKGQFEKALDDILPGTQLTLRELLDKTNAHFTLIGRLDDKKRLPIPESGGKFTLPTPETALVVDGMGWFLEEIKTMITREMNGKEPFTMKTVGDATTVTLKMAVTPPPLSWQPVIRFEGKTGRLIVANDAKFMAVLLSKEPRLQNGAAFKSATLGLPEQGNLLAFVSPRLQKEVRQLIRSSMEYSSALKSALEEAKENQSAAMKLGDMILEIVLPNQPSGFAIASANLPDGILVASNLQFSLTGSLSQVVTSLGMAGGLGYSSMSTVREEAKAVQGMNDAKQVGIALLIYANDKGKFPETLAELTTEGLLTAEMLKCVNPVTGESEEWIYHAGLKPSEGTAEILLAAPFVTPDFKRTVVYADGSVAAISEEEYTTKMKKP